MKESEFPDRNASQAVLGFQFQANAAIVLFIKNILDAESG